MHQEVIWQFPSGKVSLIFQKLAELFGRTGKMIY